MGVMGIAALDWEDGGASLDGEDGGARLMVVMGALCLMDRACFFLSIRNLVN